MTASLAITQPASSLMRRPWRSGLFSKLFAFTPLWIWIYAYFAWHPTFHPLYDGSSGLFWIPPSVLFDGVALFWMSIGVYVLWGARSRLVAAFVYLLFTIPATIALILGPAIVLILQNAS